MSTMSNILLVNVSWNPNGWRNININPQSGHSYARTYPGHESLNFKFDKKGIDSNKLIYGYAQRKHLPKSFDKGGLVIFNSKNTEIHSGQIVGVYGNAEAIEEKVFKVNG